jgi:exosortase A-associated hydrolase 2
VNARQCGIEGFFLPLDPGGRFCLLHQPGVDGPRRGAILYVHPFAEEINKSRRMAAQQARALAALGYAVLQIDLFGCGDSSGEFGEASIASWKCDLDAAAEWLLVQGLGPLGVWGLRFGALLAIDWAATTKLPLEGLLLWQPVHSGEVHLTQFLRIGVASQMLSTSAGSGGSLRKRLAARKTVEVAGYEVTQELAAGMDALRLAAVTPRAPVKWFEVVPGAGEGMPPASMRIVEQWRANSVRLQVETVVGDPFWTTVEVTDCPALLEATTRTAAPSWK